jgi:GNAT superfamily N-acetyltransferase
MNIKIAETDREIGACHPVMRELRSHISEDEFISRVRDQEENGYRLIYLESEGSLIAIAWVRVGENLAWGRFLYIDDLVTSSAFRSQDYGAKLLSWIRGYARNEGCTQVHLDSGLQRPEAHRFYEREGMTKTGPILAPKNVLASPPKGGAV